MKIVGRIAETKTKSLVMTAVCVALTAVLAQISFPLPFTQVPVSLGIMGAFLCGGILGPIYGTLAIAVYLVMGAIGLPVFANFNSGIAALVGPTGGYIVGYLFTAFFSGLFSRSNNRYLVFTGYMIGLVICYAFGTVWYSIYMHVGILPALAACVAPFVVLDVTKAVFAYALSKAVRRAVKLN